LAQVLRPIQGIFDPADTPDLLVGLGDPDDAAVWRLDEDRALVVTTDFFTPVVDEPFEFGAIAAANSLSDVYAMGGTPFLALNIACLPPDLPANISGEILRGGAEKAKEAGVVIAGGHTVQDEEPKFGLIVLGFVNPEHAITKGGAQVGDSLVLTKPLGFGVTATALKQEKASAHEIGELTRWMVRLNRDASQIAVDLGLRGGTDVTGFSLLGHGLELAQASKVGLRLQYKNIPFLSEADKFAEQGTFPGGAYDNREFFGPQITFDSSLTEIQQLLLFDPQTSGGLLLSVPPDKITEFLHQAHQIGQPAWEVGEVVEGDGIEVLKSASQDVGKS
jgi:selenide,water dikinase